MGTVLGHRLTRIGGALLLGAVAASLVLVPAWAARSDWFAAEHIPLLRAVLDGWERPWAGARPGLITLLRAATPDVGDPFPAWILLLAGVRLLGLAVLAGLAGRGRGLAPGLGTALLAALAAACFVPTRFDNVGTTAATTLGLLALVTVPVGPRGLLAGLVAGVAGLVEPRVWLALIPGALGAAADTNRGTRWTRALPTVVACGIGVAASWAGTAVKPTLDALDGWPVWSGEGLPSAFALAALWLSAPAPPFVRALGLLAGLAVAAGGPLPAAIVVGLSSAATMLLGGARTGPALVLGGVLTGLDDVAAFGAALTAGAAITGLPLPGRVGAWILGLLLTLPVIRQPRPVPLPPEEHERLLGLSALVSDMGPSEAVWIPPARPTDALLGLTGMFPRDQLARPAAVSVGDYLLLNPPPDSIEKNLQSRSRVAPSSVRWLGDDARAIERLGPEDHPRTVPAGWYAIGLAPAHLGGRTYGSALHAIDGCGRRWTAAAPSIDVTIGLEVVHLREECPGLTLAWTGEPALEANFILAPLNPEPVLSARRASGPAGITAPAR